MDSLLPLINETETQKAFPVFPKVDFSMLTQDVRDYMQSTLPSVKNIVLCGMETHVCVLQTCYDLMNNGYKVHLCVDAISSRSPVDRKVALNQLQKDGAILTTAENVAFQLIGSKNHPHFRADTILFPTVQRDVIVHSAQTVLYDRSLVQAIVRCGHSGQGSHSQRIRSDTA